MKNFLIMAVVALAISSCGFIKDNVSGIAGGAVAIASAPTVAEAIKACVADDPVAQEALKPAGEFFAVGHKVITERGGDIPILTLIEESPAYYADIGPQWDSIWLALDGKDCGAVVDQWRGNSEAAFSVAQKVVARKDRLTKACGVYAGMAPLASFVLPIALPSRVPGCS